MNDETKDKLHNRFMQRQAQLLDLNINVLEEHIECDLQDRFVMDASDYEHFKRECVKDLLYYTDYSKSYCLLVFGIWCIDNIVKFW